MKITTFNANGIRSAARKGFYDWLSVATPDVVCIQELKAQEDQLIGDLFFPTDYRAYFECAEKKGYSGVAVYTRHEPSQVTCGIGWPEFDAEGRFLKTDFGNLSVISIYIPSGTSSHERQLIKEDMIARLKKTLLNYRHDGRTYIICGDLNIAHKPIDLRNWKSNRKNSGFLPQERAWMDWLIDTAGFVDAFRVVDSRPNQYTWWSNRGQSYAKNVGWRLDYQIVTPNLRKAVRSASIYTDIKFSDHAPLTIDYDWGLG